jgi:hypothetical protein
MKRYACGCVVEGRIDSDSGRFGQPLDWAFGAYLGGLGDGSLRSQYRFDAYGSGCQPDSGGRPSDVSEETSPGDRRWGVLGLLLLVFNRVIPSRFFLFFHPGFSYEKVQQAASLLVLQIFILSGCQQAGSLLYIFGSSY